MHIKPRALGCPKPRKKLLISSRVIFPNLLTVFQASGLATGTSRPMFGPLPLQIQWSESIAHVLELQLQLVANVLQPAEASRDHPNLTCHKQICACMSLRSSARCVGATKRVHSLLTTSQDGRISAPRRPARDGRFVSGVLDSTLEASRLSAQLGGGRLGPELLPRRGPLLADPFRPPPTSTWLPT